MKNGEPSIRRRSLLVFTASAVVAGTTGCLGDIDAQGADSGEKEEGEGEGEEEVVEAEPADYPDESCAVCARGVTDYPDWNAQILHEDGERAFFCTSGCMGAYYTSPRSFGVSDADVAEVWVTDYETGETIDGQDAYYLFIFDPELVETPAGRNPHPFADRERAEEFTDGLEGVSRGEVERFSRTAMNRCVW